MFAFQSSRFVFCLVFKSIKIHALHFMAQLQMDDRQIVNRFVCFAFVNYIHLQYTRLYGQTYGGCVKEQKQK